MTTTLNNYTIDDFIKIQPIIFEYCVNLTQKKRETFWCRDLADAKELYQEVFLYVHDNYFNKPKEPTYELKFIQIMKNCTYWTFHRRITSANSRIYRSLNRIDDSPKDFFMFEQANYEPAKIHLDFKKSIDYQYYIKTLTPIEVKAIELYLQGYAIKEIDKICNKRRGFLDYLIRNKLSKIVKKDVAKKSKPVKSLVDRTRTVKNLKEDDVDFLKSKINNFDIIFKSKNTKNIKLYSLYLQGVSITEISETFKIPKGQIGVELFRIKERIRKYDIR